MGVQAVRRCEVCGTELVRRRGHSRAQWEGKRFCGQACVGVSQRKPHDCACGCGERPLPQRKWVKGHRPKSRLKGYIRIYKPSHPLANADGHVLEHRMVLYDAGVDIPPGSNVHHKNGIKDDNRLENLEVLAKSEHHRLHVRTAGFVVNQYGTWPVRS